MRPPPGASLAGGRESVTAPNQQRLFGGILATVPAIASQAPRRKAQGTRTRRSDSTNRRDRTKRCLAAARPGAVGGHSRGYSVQPYEDTRYSAARQEARVNAKQRMVVAERAGHCCEYCRSQERFATERFSVEHIQPRSRGGRSVSSNCALACQGCNNHKYDRSEAIDTLTGRTVPLFHPRKQAWQDHFQWNDDYTLMIGISEIGRATIDALKLNRHNLVNLRRILAVRYEHPPRAGW